MPVPDNYLTDNLRKTDIFKVCNGLQYKGQAYHNVRGESFGMLAGREIGWLLKNNLVAAPVDSLQRGMDR
jgi:hypothetical protein